MHKYDGSFQGVGKSFSCLLDGMKNAQKTAILDRYWRTKGGHHQMSKRDTNLPLEREIE
jgi:hypothetical protein